jgi:hypothetical protein
MGEKITQTMALEVWTLTSAADMFDCFKDLVGHGYRGELKSYPKDTSIGPQALTVPGWFLEVNADDKPSVTATIGQTVVLFGGVLEAMLSEAYEARFGG